MVWLTLSFVLCYLIPHQLSTILHCEFATHNKYLGYFSVSPGKFHAPSFLSIKAKNSEQCKERCRRDESCLAAAFNMKLECSFYNTTFLNVHFDNSYDNVVYRWFRCNWNAWSKDPTDGRCKGMFIGYMDTTVKVSFPYMVLETKYLNEDECLDKCTANVYCKIINYDVPMNRCSLYQGWPSLYVRNQSRNGTKMFEWMCIPNFIETLVWNQSPPKVNIAKCTGHWNITDRDVNISSITSSGALFYTQSFKACLAECHAHLFCTEVLFNVTYSACLLLNVEASANNEYRVNYNFIQFTWICTKNDSVWPPETEKEMMYEKLGLRCVTLVNNTDVFISNDDCGKPGTNFSRCTSRSVKGKWTATDSCIVNQIFWSFGTKTSTLNITGTYSEYLTKIYTGLASFWLAHRDPHIFNRTNYLECRRFDSSRVIKATHEYDIISRQGWSALKSRGQLPTNKNGPAKIIIIDSSEIPFFGCRTIMACTSILRNLQIRYFKGIGPIPKLGDAPYNFMLNEDGTVYSIRGWNRSCAAFPDHPESLCFAFIGSFSEKFPTIEFLEGVKELINLAVTKGFLQHNYTLYVYSDATGVEKRKNLALILKNWYRYRGFTPRTCVNQSVSTIVANVVATILIVLGIVFLWSTLYFQKKCRKCFFLKNIHFTQIHPLLDRLESNSICNVGVFVPFMAKYCIITEKSSPLYPNENSKVVKVLKLWFLNQCLETSASNKRDSNLLDYLETVSRNNGKFHNGNIHIFRGRASLENKLTLDHLFILLCFSDSKSYRVFTDATASGACICRLFSLNLQSYCNIRYNID